MNNDELLTRLRETSVVLFDGPRQGSGHLVALGYAATANHCVLKWDDEQSYPVSVGGSHRPVQTRAQVIWRDLDHDVALLKVDGVEGIAPLPVGAAPRFGQEWISYGYPLVVANQDGPVGAPLRGQVEIASDINQDGHLRMVVSAVQAQAGNGVSLRGCSGSAVMVDGKLVGVITQQFVDRNDHDFMVMGAMSVCLFEQVMGRFPSEVRCLRAPVQAAPGKIQQAGLPAASAQRAHTVPAAVEIYQLLSWCDRHTVVKAVQDWAGASTDPHLGVLCISAHADHRPHGLFARVVEELNRWSPKLQAGQCKIVRNDWDDNESSFGALALQALRIGSDREIVTSREFQNGPATVLVTANLDCSPLSPPQIVQRVNAAARWLSAFKTESKRILVVVSLQFGTESLGLFNRLRGKTETRDRIKAAMNVLRDQPGTRHPCIVEPLIELNDHYTQADLREWCDREFPVREALGRALDALSDAQMSKWFNNNRCELGELGHLLDAWYSQRQIALRKTYGL